LSPWGDLKIEGYIDGKLRKTLTLSGSGRDADFKVVADDAELVGDGRDATRVVVMVTDEYANIRPFATAAIALALTGPGEIIGENPLVPAGGAAAVWVRTKESAGVVNLTATHPFLGKRSIAIRVRPAEPEAV
jgi:beta-galactosidase